MDVMQHPSGPAPAPTPAPKGEEIPLRRDREAEREILAHFESEQAKEHTPHFKPFEPTCEACKRIAEKGGYTSTLGVVHTYERGCRHATAHATSEELGQFGSALNPDA
jgi:hypothetical protein